MKIGDFIKVKNGASEWMKQQGFWLECMPNSINGEYGRITDDYTKLTGNHSHYEIEFGYEYRIGVHPQWLQKDDRTVYFVDDPETNYEVKKLNELEPSIYGD